MNGKKFSTRDLVNTLLIALAGYLAKVFGLVDLPSFY
jgi:hypothetical protein